MLRSSARKSSRVCGEYWPPTGVSAGLGASPSIAALLRSERSILLGSCARKGCATPAARHTATAIVVRILFFMLFSFALRMVYCPLNKKKETSKKGPLSRRLAVKGFQLQVDRVTEPIGERRSMDSGLYCPRRHPKCQGDLLTLSSTFTRPTYRETTISNSGLPGIVLAPRPPEENRPDASP